MNLEGWVSVLRSVTESLSVYQQTSISLSWANCC